MVSAKLVPRLNPLQEKALSVQEILVFSASSSSSSCSIVGLVISAMGMKIKGFYKSLKFITQLFVVKEREIEIGCPTDVKHVAHIGWDGPSGTGPSWMSEFKTAPDFTTSLGNLNDRKDLNSLSSNTMSRPDHGESSKRTSDKFKDTPSPDHPRPKKQKRRKPKVVSPTSSSSSSSTKHIRAAKPATTHSEREASQPVIQV